jgi:hypothetical protein
MTWFWLNIPLGAVFFLAISAIPFWMVIRHPDDRPASTDAAGTSAAASAGPVMAAAVTQRAGRTVVPAPGLFGRVPGRLPRAPGESPRAFGEPCSGTNI